MEVNKIFKQRLSEEVWYQTYKWETDNSVEDTFRRVAKELSSIEKNPDYYEEIYFKFLSNFKYVPGGRIISNAGTGLHGTSYVNCFVSGFQGESQDSIEGIFDELKRQAKILKSEGGYGFCANVLRPNGSYIKGIGSESPGAVTMLDLWDTVSKVITSGSSSKKNKGKGKNKIRKGAMMVTLVCSHPDIEEYITAKQQPGRLTKFNMSVLITDNFINAVKNNLPWKLEFPELTHPQYDKDWDGDLETWKEKGYATKVYKEYTNANELWDLITKSTYTRNEPGILFIDRANHLSNLKSVKYQATNPCVPPGIETLTEEGYIAIEKLINKKIKIWNGFEFSEVIPRQTGTNQNLVKVNLSSGQTLPCTPYHKWILSNGKKVEAKDLVKGDKLIKADYPIIYSGEKIENAYLKGFYCGDGSENKKEIWLYPPRHSCAEKLIKNGGILCDYNLNRDVRVIKFDEILDKKYIPINGNIYSRIEWLAGLIDSDGCESKEGGIQISSVDKNFLLKTQKMLTTLGTFSKVVPMNEKQNKMLPDGKDGEKEYSFKESYRLLIGAFSVLDLKKLGFCCSRLTLNKIPNRDASRFVTVESVEDFGFSEKVYCYTEPLRNSACFEGVLTANCGEQFLEKEGGSCVLGSINLTQYINENRTDFDYDSLKEDIRHIVRFQDAINDVTSFPLPNQAEIAKRNRRVGIGYMGYGSALYLLKLSYGSKEALAITEKLCSFITNEIYKSSALVAKEKGSFPSFNKEDFLQSNFVKQALTKETISHIEKYGIRNAFLTTCAPTGNTGCFANLVSGGLEPVISDSYIRTMIVPYAPEELSVPKNISWENSSCTELGIWAWAKEGDESILKTDFQGNTYKYDRSRGLVKEEVVYDYAVLEMGEEYWKDKEEMSPEKFYGKTIFNLKVEDHLSTMAIFAKYIDSSISKTINLPNDYSFEQFKDVYLKAYDTGYIKGVTTYRMGTMTNVVSVKEDPKDPSNRPKSVVINHAPKRPKSLPCDVHITQIKGEKWYVFIGILEGYPFEVFAGKVTVKLPEKGTISKLKSKTYIFEAEGIEPLNILETYGEHGSYVYAKMLSHGVPLWSIIDMCDKMLENVLGFNKAMGRIIKKYIKNEDVKFFKCGECGSSKMIFQEGCILCRNCGNSKCG